MSIRSIAWKDNAITIIDQTKLPGEFVYLPIRDIKTLWHAIKALKVRGAPALGAAAALGVYLGIRGSKARNFAAFFKELDRVSRYLASSRPTARNLFWGIERMCSVAVKNKHEPIVAVKKLMLKQALQIIEDDRRICRLIGSYGSKLIKDNARILTVCNTGILATIDYGTALGVVYKAHEQGKRIKVYASETRPLLQGARLTSWELKRKGIDVTVQCDNMSAVLMQQGKVDLVIAGADRIAANGDTANKIGTYSLAVLAQYHKIPFYIAAPVSTFDFDIASGAEIPIEQRNGAEVRELLFKKPMTAKGVSIFNPAFDVTPHSLITGIITEKGILKPPFIQTIKRALR
ncbi:MAG TPA: S-methyl-5-thioribose-1-phosphate isomerase [Candidatus Omnitrophota bacterium]|nr:S-methyl-5-thioribose-1-phosphate isomerase [Candidatus Omnitrophota bacterium]HPT07344.1 S-methyl-5-thioribose-1-phosphate isomerase [Candidatus Omnitrophota bacterium]